VTTLVIIVTTTTMTHKAYINVTGGIYPNLTLGDQCKVLYPNRS